MEEFATFILGVIVALIGVYIIVVETYHLLLTNLAADVVFLSAIGVFIYWHHETILTFLYGLTPHPAESVVDDAIYSGEPIDGSLYAELAEPEFGGGIQGAVRANQARKLAERLREHEAEIRATEAREMERACREMEQENAITRAHTDLLKAGIDHETAVVRLDEVREQRRNR